MNVTTLDQTVYVITNEDETVTVSTHQEVTTYLEDVIAGTNISIDKTDPKNPIISASTSIQTVTSSATVTALTTNDYVEITAQAEALTLANPSGTASNFDMIVYRIEDNGTARAITFGSEFRALGTTLPTTTVLGKIMYLVTVYHSTDIKWDVVSVIQQA